MVHEFVSSAKAERAALAQGMHPKNNIGRIKEGGLAHGKIGGRLSFAFKSGMQ